MSFHSIKCKSLYNKDTKIWSGRKCKSKYFSDCSIGKEAIESLLKDPEHIAQISYPSDAHFTNREIANLSIRVAQHFKELGLQQCDIIGFCGMNSDYVAALFFGAMLAGLTVSTLDPSFDNDCIKHAFGITKPVVMFCDGSIYDNVKGALNELNLSINTYTMCQHIQGVPEITEFLQKAGSEDAFVDMHRDDKLLCFSTLAWISGMVSLIQGTLYGTRRIISDKIFVPEDLFQIIEKYNVTIIIGPPSQLAMSLASNTINNFDLSSMITFVCTGGAEIFYATNKIYERLWHD